MSKVYSKRMKKVDKSGMETIFAIVCFKCKIPFRLKSKFDKTTHCPRCRCR